MIITFIENVIEKTLCSIFAYFPHPRLTIRNTFERRVIVRYIFNIFPHRHVLLKFHDLEQRGQKYFKKFTGTKESGHFELSY